jgi:hypothetical protein
VHFRITRALHTKQGADQDSKEARDMAAPVVSAHRQACGDDGGTVCSSNSTWFHWQIRLLRIRLGRIISDVRRKIAGDRQLEAAFASALTRAEQIRSQQQR